MRRVAGLGSQLVGLQARTAVSGLKVFRQARFRAGRVQGPVYARRNKEGEAPHASRDLVPGNEAERDKNMDTKEIANKKMRGFAALTPERRSEISRKGGIIAHLKGSAHEWDSTAAREAGRKGGLASRAVRAPAAPHETAREPAPLGARPESTASAQPMSPNLTSARPANDQIGMSANRDAS